MSEYLISLDSAIIVVEVSELGIFLLKVKIIKVVLDRLTPIFQLKKYSKKRFKCVSAHENAAVGKIALLVILGSQSCKRDIRHIMQS